MGAGPKGRNSLLSTKQTGLPATASTAPAAAARTGVAPTARSRVSPTAVRRRRRTRRAIARARRLLPRRAVTRARLLRPLCLRSLSLVGPIVLTRRIVRLPCRRARSGRAERVPAVGPLVLVRRRPLRRRLARTRLAEPPDAIRPGGGRLVAARRLCRPRILGRAAHARLAKPAIPGLSLTCTRRAAGSSLPGCSPSLHRGLLAAREETRVITRMRNVGCRPVRKLAAGRAGTHRHLSANRPCNAHLRSGYALDATELSVAEVLCTDRRNAVRTTRISIYICDVCARNVNASVEAADAVEPAAPPGIEGFERSQRHPSDTPVPKSAAKAHPAAESEEPNQGRRPIGAHAESAGVPAPAVAGIQEPTTVMIRCPAPGARPQPHPSTPAFPNPAAIAIRRPAGCHHRRMPDIAVRRHIRPCAGIIQIFSAVGRRSETSS